ncbi:unnamed protein product [Caenorhabditis angaria]|uniref:SXP/RAL-2 family protein Ani s 5-like cation-binding domain-containing protein n=1 Tax=Caenorhabditis angaria TaxID=860376 RepID=A0A9P1N3I3_9PELO|nr:unnamed protein product [Caenorhabditis angaria]
MNFLLIFLISTLVPFCQSTAIQIRFQPSPLPQRNVQKLILLQQISTLSDELYQKTSHLTMRLNQLSIFSKNAQSLNVPDEKLVQILQSLKVLKGRVYKQQPGWNSALLGNIFAGLGNALGAIGGLGGGLGGLGGAGLGGALGGGGGGGGCGCGRANCCGGGGCPFANGGAGAGAAGAGGVGAGGAGAGGANAGAAVGGDAAAGGDNGGVGH